MVEASEEIRNQEGITKEDQALVAWKMIQENGLEGVDLANPDSLKVADYTADEIRQDEHSVDWDTAFNEVETAEKSKQDKLNKERMKTHQEEIERQKKAALKQLQESMAQHEKEKKATEEAQKREKERIEAEKREMQS